jgi:molecular chaperone GrpE
MTPEAIEAILGDFRAWLLEAREAPPVESAPDFDVATVLQHFIALRQEVNLQTRASRGQLEQNAQTILLLQEALGTAHRHQNARSDRAERADEELLRPVLKALVDAHDALSLAEREVRRQRECVPEPAPATVDVPAPPAMNLKFPHWARWLGLDVSIEAQLAPLRAWHVEQSRARTPFSVDESAQKSQQALDAVLVGYRMSLQRLERAMQQQGLEPIACVGEPFDPETMEVAEVAREDGRTRTEVTQEIRRGYRWRGRLFRFAQVRVVRP